MLKTQVQFPAFPGRAEKPRELLLVSVDDTEQDDPTLYKGDSQVPGHGASFNR